MENCKHLEQVTIRFAGDSGDGMQLTGTQFSNTSALVGNDLSTLPDYPAEIRAPAGTLFGVSGFQLQFSSREIHTPGDQVDVLVAMNPAALKVNLRHLKNNGIIIANSDAFSARNLKLAGYTENPLEDDTLAGYQLFAVPVTTLTKQALVEVPLGARDKDRCKNFFALGITYWMFSRPLDVTLQWIDEKFKTKPDVAEANKKALNAGYNYALSTEIFTTSYCVLEAKSQPGLYRNITGNEALVLGLITAAEKSGRQLFMGGYPITPASDILHYLSRYRHFDVKTFQAEDEIAGVGAAIGASFAGALGVTASSGPGIALKTEFLGYAVMTELPLVVVDVQRGGPSTGLPTKTEQSDLLQAFYGRNGEAPVPIVAAQSPADCFVAALEAARVALTFTTPVMLLTDGYLANGAEPWLIPDPDTIPKIDVPVASAGQEYQPYARDPETLSRKMAIPGTEGLEHRLGGLEKENITGNVTYDPDNHDMMVHLRAEKIKRVAGHIPRPELQGDAEGPLLVISWGSTYGSVFSARDTLAREGKTFSWLHLRWLNPLPDVLDDVIHNFKHILIPEINAGQLIRIIRDRYLVDAKGFNKVRGLPLQTGELVETILTYL